ncbi:topless-related protein 1 [Raphanus sativus]|uniref:Topless-related protein 1 n=1 Tax=Raphanus sativus TaxID=3726 RepID=A0A6J0LQH9_RAPSA|nr:topless-related protein 1 [Raphanus sativus]
MASLEKDLMFLILQFLGEKKHTETVHRLESESGCYFNMRYFEELATQGKWDEMEKYLSGFTKIEDNLESTQIFFQIRKHKYLEALDKRDHAKALDILRKDLKVFELDLFKEMSLLLTMDDFRANPILSTYGDTTSARGHLFRELEKLIEANPLLRDKLQFPVLAASRLRTLIDQSLNWQHHLCKNPMPNPDIATLFVDHTCDQPIAEQASSPAITHFMGGVPNITGFPPMSPHVVPGSANAGITTADQATSLAARKKNGVLTLADGKSRTSNVSSEGPTPWKVTEITEPSQCYSLRLPDNVTDTKVSRLIYTNSGSGVLALASNAEHKLWKWQKSDDNLTGKATANAHPVLRKPKSGITMINETSDKNPEEAIPCLALSKKDAFVVSASGGKISVFNMTTFKTEKTYMPPPPAATFLALLPSDSNIVGVGFEDSSIQIYNLKTSEVIHILKGHGNRITGLAFSLALGILVSSSADSQVCIWSIAGWEKRNSMYMDTPRGRSRPAVSDVRVQFNQNQNHLLVVNEEQIAIYDAQKLDWLNTWFPRKATGRRITSGTYSADSQSIFVSFEDGTVSVLAALNLRLRCRINPTAYMPLNPSFVRVLVIAAHPSESDQFAVGLSNGHVYVVEPSESEGTWGTSPPGST